jgi:hypothetical protein
MKKIDLLQQLPESFKINTMRNKKTGVWVAELTELDLCTEADSFFGLILNVNDLIYTYFDIPKAIQPKVFYMPPEPLEKSENATHLKSNVENQMTFNILINPQLSGYIHS